MEGRTMQIDLPVLPLFEIAAEANCSEAPQKIERLPFCRRPAIGGKCVKCGNGLRGADQDIDVAHDSPGCDRQALSVLSTSLENEKLNLALLEPIEGGSGFSKSQLRLSP